MVNEILKKSSFKNFINAKKGKRVILFGAGPRGLAYMDDILAEDDIVAYIVDNDPKLQDSRKVVCGRELIIHSPDKLRQENPGDFLILITHVHILEGGSQLWEMGIRDFWALCLFHDYFIPRGITWGFPGVKPNISPNPYAGRKLQVNLQMSDKCNLRCKMCFREAMPEATAKILKNVRGEVPYETILSILDQIAEIKDLVDLRGVTLSAIGEPLLHSRFDDLVRETKARNLPLQMITNGVTLKGDTAVALLLADAGISISITGIILEIYKDFQGFAPTMEKTKTILDTVVENIKELVKQKAMLHSNSSISVRYLVTEENAGHFVDYLSFFHELGVGVNPGILIDRTEEAPSPNRQYIYKEATGEGYWNLWADKKGGYFNSLPCFFPLVIDMKGDILPCCDVRYPIPFTIIGNVHENSLREILFSKSTLDMIQAIDTLDIDNMPTQCKVCRHLMT